MDGSYTIGYYGRDGARIALDQLDPMTYEKAHVMISKQSRPANWFVVLLPISGMLLESDR